MLRHPMRRFTKTQIREYVEKNWPGMSAFLLPGCASRADVATFTNAVRRDQVRALHNLREALSPLKKALDEAELQLRLPPP